MPSQQSVSVNNINGFIGSSDEEELSDDEYLLLLRKKECLAYHHICGVFRAQGRLSPEKLKLLKEIASVLGIPEVRHKAECSIAVNNSELSKIAECVAGPNTDEEWRKEAMTGEKEEPEQRIRSAHTPLIGALVRHVERTIATDNSRKKWSQMITLKTLSSGNVVKVSNVETESSRHKRYVEEPIKKKNIIEETIKLGIKDEIKEEDMDGESSSSVSTTSEPEDLQIPEQTVKDEKLEELEKKPTPDPDLTLMPPPSPVVTMHSSSSSTTSLITPSPVISTLHIPSPAPIESLPDTPNVITVPPSSSIITLPSSPAVITVPPSSSILTIPSTPAVITVPPSSSILTLSSQSPSVITVPPATSLPSSSVPVTMSTLPLPVFTTPPLPTRTKTCEIDEGTPVMSDDLQFASLSESIDSALPPLVVVPPPEPVIAIPNSPTLIIPSGMSIQLSEESNKRKRALSHDRELNECSATSPKTMTFSHISKMKPVMVSVANMSAASFKVTPTVSRAKIAVTNQSAVSAPTQKVIIVSNASSGCAPVIQRSLNVPMGVPFIRTTQPRLQTTPVSSGLGKVRPRMVTVPAKCRAKSSPLVIPVSGHNIQLKGNFNLKQDNVTVMDKNEKKKMLLGSMTPAKILPKPQSSMFIVNTNQGTQKISSPVGLQIGGQTTKMMSPRVVDGSSSKQNVVILQKGSGKPQRVTLTNTSKDVVQKLMSKKCVVIQPPKALPKTICPKPSPPAALHAPGPSTSGSNVVVLDLSQEQYRQNLSSKTLAEILQASGLLSVPSATPTTTSVSGEAVELLGETAEQQVMAAVEEELQTDSSDQLYTITSDMDATNMILTEGSSTDNLNTSQFVVDPVPAGVEQELVRQQFAIHRDGAVTIQHSNIDMPANMSLEEYSSQQLENQGLN